MEEPARMRKRRTSWLWGIADHEYAGDLATPLLFRTRKEARGFCAPAKQRFYPVKVEVSWDIQEKDRW